MKITNEIEIQVQQVQCKYQLLMYCAFIKKNLKLLDLPGPSHFGWYLQLFVPIELLC